jgi:hypothetical protein
MDKHDLRWKNFCELARGRNLLQRVELKLPVDGPSGEEFDKVLEMVLERFRKRVESFWREFSFDESDDVSFTTEGGQAMFEGAMIFINDGFILAYRTIAEFQKKGV